MEILSNPPFHPLESGLAWGGGRKEEEGEEEFTEVYINSRVHSENSLWREALDSGVIRTQPSTSSTLI